MRFISRKLQMNEYISGITLVAFVNEVPDIFANMLSIRQRSALFSKTVSNCLIEVLFCGGIICFMKPFKMDGHAIVRDILFLLMGVELVAYLIADDEFVSGTDCCGKSSLLFPSSSSLLSCISISHSHLYALCLLSDHPSN